MELFTATVQRNLSYLVVAGVLMLIILHGTGWIEIDINLIEKLIDAVLLVVILFWFNRQRPDGAAIPPGAAGKSTTTTETIVTDPKGAATIPAKTAITTSKETADVSKDKP
jgi:hypothetical protein